MSEKNPFQRLALILVTILVGALLLFRWDEGGFRLDLQPGLDIAGGVSMIFEINDEGIDDPNLAETMKGLLQKRVDPNGVYNLVWRVHGKNRLEVQMPLPPKDAAARREAYQAARDALFTANMKLSDLEEAFAMPAGQRAARLQELAAETPGRLELLQRAAERRDAVIAAREALQTASAPSTAPTTEPADSPQLALRDAEEAYQDAIDAALATNIDPRRFQTYLELDAKSPARKAAIAELKAQHPRLASQIDVAVEKYQEWRSRANVLEGPADLRRLLRGAGVLEFRILAEPNPQNPTIYDRHREQLLERGPVAHPGDPYQWFKIDNPLAFFNKSSPSEVRKLDPREASVLWVVERLGDDWYVLGKTGAENGLLRDSPRKWQVKGAGRDRDERGRNAVVFTLDTVGGDLFRRLTGANINKQLAILVDDVAYSAANIETEIGSTGRITGDFSAEKINYLIQTFQAGALPARLKDTPISERTIGSSLGEQNLRQAMNSGLIGALVVFALMGGYYLKCGMIANGAVALNVFLTLAVMAMLDARITLDGVAGLILSLGMAVDANVLIHERMREEQERGSSLWNVIRSGYDKAFRAILDGHVTTLLTSVIIYYVGSDEIRGFGLMLGWGIVLSLFTSVFVTRTLLILMVKYGWIRRIEMFKAISVPNIDWVGKRRFFIPLSLFLTVAGLALMLMRSPRDYLDVEFLGGVSADIETRPVQGATPLTDTAITRLLEAEATRIEQQAAKLAQATVEPDPQHPQQFVVTAPDVPAPNLIALLREPLEDANLLQRDGIAPTASGTAVLVRTNENVTQDRLAAFIREQRTSAARSAENLSHANVSTVIEGPGTSGRYWNITTTETNKLLVQQAIVGALGDRLQVRPRVQYVVRGQDGNAFPIQGRRLSDALTGDLGVEVPPVDTSNFLGGAAMVFDQLDPPQAVAPGAPGSLLERIRNMRLQPGFLELPWREMDVVGLQPAVDENGRRLTDEGGNPLYRSVAVLVADPAIRYSDTDPEQWQAQLAGPELDLVRSTLDTEQTLRKVTQFKPQIAAQSQARALVAILLSWAMIIVYLWIRFGSFMYGFSAVIGLVHTVLIALAFVGIAGLVGGPGTFFGEYLLIDNFRINMAVIAALLTLIGYAVNDTIVTFDRIREIRGRLGIVTAETVNRAINECMSRTLLTGTTVLSVLLVMYIFGGPSLRGFNFAMFIGVITGTYSSIAIAAPLLLLRLDRRLAAERVPATVSR